VVSIDESDQGIGIRNLLEAGLHFGHQTKRWNPKMKRFIFDKRNGIHIIDLAKSLAMLKEALKFLYDIIAAGKSVLFVGTKKQAQGIIKETALSCNQPYVTTRWLGGTLTNSKTIRASIKRMREIEKLEKNDAFASMHKKEASSLRHELEKLRRNLSGIAEMTELPGAILVIDINRESIAVAEANQLKIPVVAIVDTNCDPDLIDCPIPGNDDAIRAIGLIANAARDIILKAKDEYAKIAAELARKKESKKAEAEAVSKAGEKASRKYKTKASAEDISEEQAVPADEQDMDEDADKTTNKEGRKQKQSPGKEIRKTSRPQNKPHHVKTKAFSKAAETKKNST